jgi:Flp pilus assembly protein TadB
MNWRWLVDVRGDRPRINYLGTAVALGVGCVIGALLWWLFDPLIVLIVVLLGLPLMIWWDISTRRRHPHND